jgi:hypothetical protein
LSASIHLAALESEKSPSHTHTVHIMSLDHASADGELTQLNVDCKERRAGLPPREVEQNSQTITKIDFTGNRLTVPGRSVCVCGCECVCVYVCV